MKFEPKLWRTCCRASSDRQRTAGLVTSDALSEQHGLCEVAFLRPEPKMLRGAAQTHRQEYTMCSRSSDLKDSLVSTNG